MNKKNLGQHFLTNQGALKKIAASLELKRGDIVIEVGPGHGELSAHLLSEPINKLVAVEKDEELAEKLNFEVVRGDILKELPRLSEEIKEYKLVGNIPYYITGFLLRKISELNNKPLLTALTVQKEVAERLVAHPPKMNLLAASVQFWADAELLFTIPAQDFKPAPKVDSAVVKLTTKKREVSKENEEKYYSFIKKLFKQPRKTIKNNLGINEEELRRVGLNIKSRPQDLSVEEIKELSNR